MTFIVIDLRLVVFVLLGMACLELLYRWHMRIARLAAHPKSRCCAGRGE